jgi:DNA-binding HxlR family transcriptional regulator
MEDTHPVFHPLWPVRLGQLRRELRHASKKVLTQNLREPEDARLVVRRDLGGSVRHVEYDFNETMRPQIQARLDHLADFGDTFGSPQNKPANGVSNSRFDLDARLPTDREITNRAHTLR